MPSSSRKGGSRSRGGEVDEELEEETRPAIAPSIGFADGGDVDGPDAQPAQARGGRDRKKSRSRRELTVDVEERGSPERGSPERGRTPLEKHDRPWLNSESVKQLNKMSPKLLLDRLAEIEAGNERTRSKQLRAWAKAKDVVDRYRRDPTSLLLCATVVLPTVDSLLDWAVTADLFFSDHPAYLKSFAVQLVSGYFMGMIFIFTVLDEGGCLQIFLGVLAGMAGAVPLAILLSAFFTDTGNVRESRAAMVPYMMVQLLLEALPQSVLQSYLGITEGMLDSTDESYKPLIAVSFAVSVLGAGVSTFSIDTRLRPETEFVALYAVVAIAAYTTTTAALVMWAALMTCAFEAALFWLVLLGILCCCFGCVAMRCNGADLLLGWLMRRRAQRKASGKKKKPKKKKKKKPKKKKKKKSKKRDEEAGSSEEDLDDEESEEEAEEEEDDEEEEEEEEQKPEPVGDVEIKPSGKRRAALCLVSSFGCSLIMILTMSSIFASIEHERNNYANTSALPGAPGGVSVDNPTGDSYLSCAELPVGWNLAVNATIACVILTLLSWSIDPQFGFDFLRPKAWAERVDRRMRPPRGGVGRLMSTKEEAMNKAHAVFQWADVFGDGFLEPQEVYRLAEILGVEYDRVCWELGIKALTERQLDEHFRTSLGQKQSARERELLMEAVARGSIDEYQFVAKPPKSVDEWFSKLQLMIKY
jgi:hypothetical protein